MEGKDEVIFDTLFIKQKYEQNPSSPFGSTSYLTSTANTAVIE